MRVVDVTSFFSDTCGGIKTYYREKARCLPPLGFDCHFIVPGREETSEAFGAGTLHRVPGPSIPRSSYRLFGDLERLERLIVDLAPDVIEVGSHYMLPNLVGWATRRLRRAPRLVGFYHADYPDTYVAPAVRPLPRWAGGRAIAAAWSLVRRQHRRYGTTLTGSMEMARKLVANGVEGVRWVGLGVDVERFVPRPRLRRTTSATVVYAGRLATEKGVDVLLDAVHAVHEQTGARWVIAGSGPLHPRVRRMAARHDYVIDAGYVDDRDELARLLAGADVVVAPGPHESFSLLAAEAMACGTPVVGADRGGNAELLYASGGGVTFASGDAVSLADATSEVLSLPRRDRELLGERGRRHVAGTLTWNGVCERLSEVYRDAAPS